AEHGFAVAVGAMAGGASGHSSHRRAQQRRSSGHVDGPDFRDRAADGRGVRRAGGRGPGAAADLAQPGGGGPVSGAGEVTPSLDTNPPAVELGTDSLARRLARLTFHTDVKEERFFLILSIFIGIFSGLAVVSFRVAIEWCSIAL